MLYQATASGYRNSGISFGTTKIILVKFWFFFVSKKLETQINLKKAVRSTQNLEMPVSDAGKIIVDRQVRYY